MAVNHITRRFVHQLFLKPLDIAAIEDAKRGLIDFVAVTHCGKEDAGVHKLLQLACGGTSKVIGHPIYTTPELAALINGFMAHVLDFDDVHHELRGHPSAVLLPTLFALCDEDTTGIRFIQAYAIGVEAMAKLALSLSNVHYEKGWHNTSTIGIVGAAIAGAYLIGLTVHDTCRTIGFATTMASGMRIHFGTETKPLHAGIAAKHAIEAIRFAQVGMHVNDNSLEGYIGFLSLYGENTPKKAEALLLDVTSATWRISSPGLWFKLYPCCSGSYFGIDAAQQIGPLAVEEIEDIHITFSHYSDAALVIREPKTGEEGRFSIEYIVSLILANRPLHLASFLPEPIDDTVQQYMKKVRRSNDLEAVSKYTQIDIRLKNGTQLSARGINPKGAPSNPLTTIELENKLTSATEQADTIIATIRALNSSKVSSLLQLI